MQYFKDAPNNKKICVLCNHYCHLSDGQIGICGVNKNSGGEIECLVYGHISAFNIDPVEKKPLYHFLPNTKILSLGTVGCNFACPFCQNHGISQEKNIDTSKYISPKEVVDIAVKNKCSSIAFTYNEPTIFYPFAKDISLLAKQKGLKSVFVSNGFESSEVIDDMVGVIDAANIDLKSFNESYYKKELKGDLEVLKRNIEHFYKNKIWIEITTLIIPTKNDSDKELSDIANFIASVDVNIPWHLSAFHPDFKELEIERTPLQTLHRAKMIGKRAGLKNIYIGNARELNPTNCQKCGYEVINRKTYEVFKDERVFGIYCPKCGEEIKGVFMSDRVANFSGSFYPNDKDEVLRYFKHFDEVLRKSDFDFKCEFEPKAIIVPHAGYIYSGFSANVAYEMIKHKSVKRVIVIGPSHKHYLEGASVSLQDNYKTPLGDLKIDTTYAKELIDKYDFLSFDNYAHLEHSTETQFPFIKHFLPNVEVIEIVYGKLRFEELESAIEYILNDSDNLLIISTDLSHFFTQEEAKRKDFLCIEAIKRLDLNIWESGCEACGRVGVKALINYAKKHNLKSQVLDYRTSFDVTKDDKRVVGYMSALIG